jgi:hypothetical protein
MSENVVVPNPAAPTPDAELENLNLLGKDGKTLPDESAAPELTDDSEQTEEERKQSRIPQWRFDEVYRRAKEAERRAEEAERKHEATERELQSVRPKSASSPNMPKHLETIDAFIQANPQIGDWGEAQKSWISEREKFKRAEWEQESQQKAAAVKEAELSENFKTRLKELPEIKEINDASSKMSKELRDYVEWLAVRLPNGPEVYKDFLLDEASRNQLNTLASLRDSHGIAYAINARSAVLLIANRQSKAESKEEISASSNAPKPVSPVRRATGSSNAEPPDSGPAKDWIRWRENQLKNK